MIAARSGSSTRDWIRLLLSCVLDRARLASAVMDPCCAAACAGAYGPFMEAAVCAMSIPA